MTAAWQNERIKRATERFGMEVLRRTSVCHEFEAFLRRIKAGGKCCLEIGTYNGISAMILSQFFDTVVCVTVEDVITDRSIKREVWEHVGAKNIVAHDVKNNAEKADIVRNIGFDFAYLDGDHVTGTASDFLLTQRCGRLLFHEYWPLQPSVWNLVNTLPKDEVTLSTYDCLAYWEKKRG